MALSNGKVVVKIDAVTGAIAGVDYSYTYVSNITSPPTEGSSLVMKTATTANITENYEMFR
jgi:hypothetical protein